MMRANEMRSNRLKNRNFRVHVNFKAVNMKYLCNTDVVIDKNVILNTEYIHVCYHKFKEKWYNDLMLNEPSKLRTYILFKK